MTRTRWPDAAGAALTTDAYGQPQQALETFGRIGAA